MRRNAAFAAQRDEDQYLAILRCVALGAGVVAIGALGFRLIEGWGLWEATYFTLVTISTVGYDDHNLTDQGEVFAAVMLLCGIGTFTYSLSTLVQIASDVDSALRRKMKRSIAECSGHVVVCGYGRIGRMICAEIERGGKECVVIERDPDGVQRAIADDRLVVSGAASDDQTLLAAGLDRAEAIVCAVDSDAENLFITVSVRDINATCRIISRAESPDAARKLERAGASLVVSPHQMAGKTIATALVHPRLTRFMHSSAAESEESCYFELGETIVQAGSNTDGKTIREVGEKLAGLVFVAIERDSVPLIVQPRGDEPFLADDVVIFAGAGAVVQRFHQETAASRLRQPALV